VSVVGGDGSGGSECHLYSLCLCIFLSSALPFSFSPLFITIHTLAGGGQRRETTAWFALLREVGRRDGAVGGGKSVRGGGVARAIPFAVELRARLWGAAAGGTIVRIGPEPCRGVRGGRRRSGARCRAWRLVIEGEIRRAEAKETQHPTANAFPESWRRGAPSYTSDRTMEFTTTTTRRPLRGGDRGSRRPSEGQTTNSRTKRHMNEPERRDEFRRHLARRRRQQRD